MRLTFYAACVLSLTANALKLDSQTQTLAHIEDGLSSAIEVDPEFDSFMLSQSYSDLDVDLGDPEAAEKQAKAVQKAAAVKAKGEASKVKTK